MRDEVKLRLNPLYFEGAPSFLLNGMILEYSCSCAVPCRAGVEEGQQ